MEHVKETWSKFAQVTKGETTYYGEYPKGTGACSLDRDTSFPPIIHELGVMKVAAGKSEYQKSLGCGMCVEITGKGEPISSAHSGKPPVKGTYKAMIVDLCGSCKGGFDLYIPGDGKWKTTFKAIECPTPSGTNGNIQLKFTGSNPWSWKIQVRNSKIPTAGLELLHDNKWICMKRTDDNYFSIGGLGEIKLPKKVRLTSITNEQLESTINHDYIINDTELKNDQPIATKIQYKGFKAGSKPDKIKCYGQGGTTSPTSSTTRATPTKSATPGTTPAKPSGASGTTPSKPSTASGTTPSKPPGASGTTPSMAPPGTTPTTTSGASGTTPSKPSTASGTTPSKPSSTSGTTPSKPSSASGTTPSKPSTASGTTPSKPSSASGTTPSKPSGASGTTPSKSSTASGTTPSKPSGASGTTTSMAPPETTPTTTSGASVSTPSKPPGISETTPQKPSGASRTTPKSTPSTQSGAQGTTTTTQSGTQGTTPTTQSGTQGITPSKAQPDTTPGTRPTTQSGAPDTSPTTQSGTQGTTPSMATPDTTPGTTPTTQSAPTTQSGTQGTTTDIDLKDFCKKRKDGIYPIEGNSSAFVMCSYETAFKWDCPDGLKFNRDLKVCDWPRNVEY